MTSEELHAQIEQAAVRQAEEAETFTTEAIRLVFEKHPNLEAIQILGYTPGFNDGDPCTHRQRTAFFKSGVNEEEEEMWEDGFYEDGDDLLDALRDHFHLLYDTNFKLIFRRGQPVEVDEYWCGY